MLGGAAQGLTFELECADLTDACVNAAGTSAKWQLESLQLHVDSVQLTSEMTASYADMLIKGESIIIPYQANACDVQYFANTGGNMIISLAKQFSRLATVMVSLESVPAGDIANTAVGSHKKMMNNIYLAASAETVASYIQVNNQRWPQFDTVGTKHHYHRLMQGLGVWNSVSHATNISSNWIWRRGG